MKLIINNNQLEGNTDQFLRRSGYAYIRDRKTGKDSYVKRLGNYHYPRLHMYVKDDNNRIEFNLHLDQKQTSYAGASAHNAEYDGEVVEREIERLKSLLKQNTESSQAKNEKLGESIGHGSIEENINNINDTKKKSWWKRFF